MGLSFRVSAITLIYLGHEVNYLGHEILKKTSDRVYFIIVEHPTGVGFWAIFSVFACLYLKKLNCVWKPYIPGILTN